MKTLLTCLIITAVALSGCKSYYLNKYCKTEITRRDSTVFVTKVKDSTVRKDSVVIHPATQATIYLPSPCDSTGKLKPGTYTSSQGTNKTQVVVTDTGITVKSNCEETVSHWRELYRQSQDSIVIIKDTKEMASIVKTVPLKWHERLKLSTGWLWWIGFIGVAGALLYGIYKVYRFFRI